MTAGTFFSYRTSIVLKSSTPGRLNGTFPCFLPSGSFGLDKLQHGSRVVVCVLRVSRVSPCGVCLPRGNKRARQRSACRRKKDRTLRKHRMKVVSLPKLVLATTRKGDTLGEGWCGGFAIVGKGLTSLLVIGNFQFQLLH